MKTEEIDGKLAQEWAEEFPNGSHVNVLDAVAGGLPAPDQETIVLVSVWVDPAAANEKVARRNARTATFKVVQEAVTGRSERVRQDLVAKQDDITHQLVTTLSSRAGPFYRAIKSTSRCLPTQHQQTPGS